MLLGELLVALPVLLLETFVNLAVVFTSVGNAELISEAANTRDTARSKLIAKVETGCIRDTLRYALGEFHRGLAPGLLRRRGSGLLRCGRSLKRLPLFVLVQQQDLALVILSSFS